MTSAPNVQARIRRIQALITLALFSDKYTDEETTMLLVQEAWWSALNLAIDEMPPANEAKSVLADALNLSDIDAFASLGSMRRI
jgi:hypothetical protein